MRYQAHLRARSTDSPRIVDSNPLRVDIDAATGAVHRSDRRWSTHPQPAWRFRCKLQDEKRSSFRREVRTAEDFKVIDSIFRRYAPESVLWFFPEESWDRAVQRPSSRRPERRAAATCIPLPLRSLHKEFEGSKPKLSRPNRHLAYRQRKRWAGLREPKTRKGASRLQKTHCGY